MTVREGEHGEPYLEIREVTSQRDLREVIAIRRTVFTDEQHLTDVVDRDPYDHGPGSVQVLARIDGEPVGVGRLGASRVTLSAQTHAIGFYRLLGFRTVGTTWIMGNIEHITMVRELDE